MNWKWDMRTFFVFFSVKISDKVEELQQPAGMKLCTHKKILHVLAPQRLREVCFFFFFTARLEWEEFTKSSPSFFCFFKPPVCRRVPLSPSAGARPQPNPTVHQLMICGSQDCAATWGRHWAMTGGPAGVWLSRHRPLTVCCRATPLGLHFCKETRTARRSVSASFAVDPRRLVIHRPTADRHRRASCQQAAVHLDGRSRWAHSVKMTGDPAAAAALKEGGGSSSFLLLINRLERGLLAACDSWNSHSTGSGGRITLLKSNTDEVWNWWLWFYTAALPK